MNDLMDINKKNHFRNLQQLHDLILEGLKNNRNTYELLTYFMYNFYSKEFSQQIKNKIKEELKRRGDLRQNKNNLVY